MTLLFVLNQNIHLIKQVVSLYNLINGFNVNDLHRLLIYYIKNNKPEACTIILTDLLDQNFVDIMRNCGASFVDMILCDGLSEDVDTFVLIRAIQLVCANYNSIKKFIFNGNEFDDETVDKLKNITINLFQKVPPRFVQKNSTSCNKWQFISNPEEFQSRDNIMRYIRRKNLNTLINVLMLANDVKLQVNMNSDFSINCNDINISPELLSSFKSVLTEYMIFFLKYKNMLSKDYQKSSDDTDKYFNNFDN